MLQGAKVPRSEWARELIDQGPIGRFDPVSELAREQKGSVPLISTFCSTERLKSAPLSTYTSHHMVKTDAGLNSLYIREITIYIRLYYYINS